MLPEGNFVLTSAGVMISAFAGSLIILADPVPEYNEFVFVFELEIEFELEYDCECGFSDRSAPSVTAISEIGVELEDNELLEVDGKSEKAWLVLSDPKSDEEFSAGPLHPVVKITEKQTNTTKTNNTSLDSLITRLFPFFRCFQQRNVER